MSEIQMMPDAFYERFNEMLKEKNVSAKKLALDIGVSKNTAYEWIWSTRQMKTSFFFKLCKYLDVNPLWLYGETDVRTNYKGA